MIFVLFNLCVDLKLWGWVKVNVYVCMLMWINEK